MGLVSKALGVVASRRLKAFDQATADPVRSQMDVFRSLLSRAVGTEWGRKFAYGEIRTPEEYRGRVPVTSYAEMAPLWHRAFEGARDVTWPGHVRFFALSSGTTSGDKIVPVTREAIESNRRSGTDLVAFMTRIGGPAALAAGKFFYLGGSTSLRERGKSLYGDASGIMTRHIPWIARSRHLPDRETAALTNWETKIERIVKTYLTADVAALSACPSWAAMLFRAMRAEARARGMGDRPIGELWPKLAFFVSYGMAFEPYRRAYLEYVGRPIHFVDTYSSSEGGMNAIQDREDAPGMRLIVDNGVFFEFVPAERARDPDPPRLHLGEVEEGKEYSVLLNTNGGIWAYPVGDVVRFVSLRPPRIVFGGRTQIMLSAYGEHVSLEEIERAIAAACEATGALVADFAVWPRIPSPEHPKPLHRWIVEFDRPPADRTAFMETIDRTIRKGNEDYDTHRTDDYGMEPPLLVEVRPKTFYEWMKLKGKLGGQHKVPRVAMNPSMGEELIAISEKLPGTNP